MGRRAARGVRRHRPRHHRGTRAEHPRPDPPQAGAHPEGHRGAVRPFGGEHLPGGALARAALLQPARAGVGALPNAPAEPLDVRLGDAPGRRDHGRIRTARRPSGRALAQGWKGGLMAREEYDVVIVGAGHNGLVTAAYLAKGGLRTLVLERRDRVGGPLASEEFVADLVGSLRADVVDYLRLGSHGFEAIEPDVVAFAPSADGQGLTLWRDPVRTATELRERPEPRDAESFIAFDRKVRSLAGFVARLQEAEPPDVTSLSFSDAGTGFTLLNALRHLGRE